MKYFAVLAIAAAVGVIAEPALTYEAPADYPVAPVDPVESSYATVVIPTYPADATYPADPVKPSYPEEGEDDYPMEELPTEEYPTEEEGDGYGEEPETDGHDEYDYGGHEDPVVYETYTTTAFTTYCPEATILTHGGKTYTITEATTFTITDCPCTLTRPVPTTPCPTTKTSTYCPPTTTTTPCPETTTTTPCPETTAMPCPDCDTHVPVPTTTPCPTTLAATTYKQAGTTTASPVQYTGAADKNAMVGGAVLGWAGVIAALIV